MIVWETDQWTATEITRQKITESCLAAAGGEVHGGSTDKARMAFGGGVVRRIEVLEFQEPRQGRVWFQSNENGVLELFRVRYDSSD